MRFKNFLLLLLYFNIIEFKCTIKLRVLLLLQSKTIKDLIKTDFCNNC